MSPPKTQPNPPTPPTAPTAPTPPSSRVARPWRCWRAGLSALCLSLPLMPLQAADTSAVQQLQRFVSQAGAAGEAGRGRQFFTTRHGGEWSCASCHGASPTGAGKHASTGKAIDPLAPAFNPRAFGDSAKVDKWFRRNCHDVLRRECSAGEKADVLAFLLSLQR